MAHWGSELRQRVSQVRHHRLYTRHLSSDLQCTSLRKTMRRGRRIQASTPTELGVPRWQGSR